MRTLTKSIISLLVVLLLIVSPFIPVYAAESSQPASYSSEYNSGTRDVVCTTLDGTSAAAYYTSGYTYDILSELSASNLYDSLQTLMRTTHSTVSSYDDCHYKADRTDCQNGDGSVSLIYTNYSATMSQWNGWNREHVWPKSLGGDTTSGGGADLHHIRPSDAVVNSTRSNKQYGNANGGTAVYGKNPATGYLGGYYSGNYFEPADNVKGDVARICLYVYVRWGSAWGATSITKVFQSVDVLLEWCELDPVDTWEMGRNEVVEDIQGNRNVFIDYPEYAWLLFGEEIPDDMTTPSGIAMDGNTSSGEAGSGSTAPDVDDGGDTPAGGAETTATVSMGDYATANGWSDAHKYTTVEVDSNITATASSGTNTGTYYTNGTNWRLYQSENATLTISAAEGCTIESVKITYASTNGGILKYNGSSASSGAAVNVNASSATFNVGNSGTATNGQARITAIEVTYTQAYSCSHADTSTETVDATCTATGSTTVTCNECGEVISSTVSPALSHSYTDGVCTLCGAAQPKYAYSFIGPESTQSYESSGGSITMPSAPTLSGSYKYTYTFVGWAATSVNDTDSAPELFTAGQTVTIDEDTSFYAVYSYDVTVAGSDSYVKKDISQIKSTDVVVITMAKGSTVYALTSANGSSSSPDAPTVSVSGDALSTEPGDALKWNINYDGTNLIIYPNGSTSTWLYCTNSNTGVRVGTNTNKTFIIDSSSGYLKHTGTNRYVGVYTTKPDWRCYTNTTGNTVGQTLAFYVLSSGTGSATYYTSVLTAKDGSSTCEHASTTLTTVDATCTAAGHTTVICNVCGGVISTTELPAKGHTVVNDAKVDPTCTESGLTAGSHCSTCDTVITAQETLAPLGHSYVDGICSTCGSAKPSDALGLDGNSFYIATKRGKGNYFYMTSDLGTASTKRYQAVDSGLATLPPSIAFSNDNSKYIFVFEFNEDDGTYCIYAYGADEDAKYLGYTSGNSGTLVSKESALRLTVVNTDGIYTISLTNGSEKRYLELNNTSGNDYFAFYTGTQTGDLSLIPVAEPCTHTSTSAVTVGPTCTEAGVTTVICNDCGYTVSTEETESALGHDMVDGICVRCGYTESYVPPSGGDSGEGEWVLVTDVSTLQPGDSIIIVAKDYNYALSTTQNSNNRGQAAVTKDGSTVTFGDGVQIITLQAGSVDGTFAFYVDSGYLYAASTGSNYLKTEANLSANSSWSIVIDADGNATVKAQGTNTVNWLRYNTSSSIFSCYKATSSQKDIVIYKLVESGSSENVSIYGASMTIGSNLAINYYVSGYTGTDYYMIFTMNGVESDRIQGDIDDASGYLKFSFTNIPPQCMTDVISATLYDGEGNVLIEGFEFSVKAYADKVLRLYSENEALSNLVADMLKYGAAAQKYKNYNQDSLATEGVDLTNKGSDANPTEADNVRQSVIEADTGIDKNVYAFTATGVRFDFDNKIYVKLKTDDIDKIKLTCNGEDVTDALVEADGVYVFYTDGILATDFGKVYTFCLYVDGVLHQTITYSVNSYAYAKQSSQTSGLADLVIALYRYGLSAKEYAGG